MSKCRVLWEHIGGTAKQCWGIKEGFLEEVHLSSSLNNKNNNLVKTDWRLKELKEESFYGILSKSSDPSQPHFSKL